MEEGAEKQTQDDLSQDRLDSTMKETGSRRHSKNNLPPLFLYIEAGNFRRAAERAKRHPKEVKIWASININSSVGNQQRLTTTKRLALHHACFKLRTSTNNVGRGIDCVVEEDPFIEVCRFILLLVEIYPDACGMRETRHGCLPIHLAAFASCIRPTNSTSSNTNPNPIFQKNDAVAASSALSPINSNFSTSALSSALPYPAIVATKHVEKTVIGSSSGTLSKPTAISYNSRSTSESTADTMRTTISAVIAEESLAGIHSEYHNVNNQQQPGRQRSPISIHTDSSIVSQSPGAGPSHTQQRQRIQSVSMGSHIFISEKREDYALKVLNSLLDAYPRGIRMESEGKRLALHTAAAGRATPRVIATLVTAYPAATRHRNKDGFLPLHLCAHWGISSSDVVVTMLKQYPDATFGRNRWERTPLEEALCMAGENGRPHQAALVRALRKHPSYWTRPEGVLFHQGHQNSLSSRDAKHNIVDIDETLASMEDTIPYDDESDDEDNLFLDSSPYYDNRNRYGRHRTNNGQEGKRVTDTSPVVNDLPTLIRNKSWESAAQCLKMAPHDANLNLKVITRGGFTSTVDFTPLHYACERRPPKEFIETLTRLCPEAVTKRTMPGGALPLHIACTWYAKKDAVDILLAMDRNACKTPDELGNIPVHSSCFSGTSSDVVESLLKAYPKAVLVRNHQGSLPEDITKRLKHHNRVSVLALLNMCRDEVITKRKTKHRRNRSEGYTHTTNEALILNGQYSHANPLNYQTIENIGSGEIEVKYSGETPAENELVWI
mmetsp:Transcript_26921/g.30155  ORF Transcript_26921/g.30155 Transcript_26921/m.30155 type:complete len:779 (-) Transcript_26921:55-2391(-)